MDPDDKEFKKTIKNARKQLETEIKSKLACILEASESTRLRMEESLPNYHEDHVAGKGDNSLQHYNLVHKFIPVPQAMKINLVINVYKIKEKDKATFFSTLEEWVLPAASTKEPEEREFVVDSGASMHMISKKDLNSAELETKRMSRSPTTVMTSDGEVQTREEATVNVKELDLLVTVMPLEETPAVLSLGNSVRIMGFHTTGPAVKKPHLTKNGKRIIRCPWSVEEFLYFIFTCFVNIFIAGYCDQHGKSSNRKK